MTQTKKENDSKNIVQRKLPVHLGKPIPARTGNDDRADKGVKNQEPVKVEGGWYGIFHAFSFPHSAVGGNHGCK